MCGISGLALSAEPAAGVAHKAVERMNDRMRSRGPDAQGSFLSPSARAALGHRRLAIIDLDARANQPMRSTDGRHAIVFNGEIYNYRELRAELEALGTSFRTSSDTEVVLALYERDGEAMLTRLRGMFALAIWDEREEEMFLARDPYGIKPLYWAEVAEGVVFASQVRALLASELVSPARSAAGLVGFLLWGTVPEPHTLYRDIYSLPAGHWLRVRRGVRGRPTCWYDVRSHWAHAGADISLEQAREIVRTSVVDSIGAHLVADVPVSVFLSAGVDSTLVAAVAAQLGHTVEGITVGFSEFAGTEADEIPVAKEAARQLGIAHTVSVVGMDEFVADFPRILDAMDQPSVDGINTWFASKAAAERGYKVALSGAGGDELFCGYRSFRDVPRLAALGRWAARVPLLGRVLDPIAASYSRFSQSPKWAAAPTLARSLESAYFLSRGIFLPSDLPKLIGERDARVGLEALGFPLPTASRIEATTSVAAVAAMESTLYLRNQLLRDADWASMAHSLELRTPLVDAALSAAVAPFTRYWTGGEGKRSLAHAASRPLPQVVMQRQKTGFGIPLASWLDAALPPRKQLEAEWGSQAIGAHWSRRLALSLVRAF